MEKDRQLLSALRAVASAVNRRDPYTSGHSERVAEYCERVAAALPALSGDEQCFPVTLGKFEVDSIEKLLNSNSATRRRNRMVP